PPARPTRRLPIVSWVTPRTTATSFQSLWLVNIEIVDSHPRQHVGRPRSGGRGYPGGLSILLCHLFQLPELGAGKEDINRPVYGHDESAPAVAKTLQPEVTVEKHRGRPENQIPRPKPYPVFPELGCLVPCVTVHVTERLGNRRDVVVQKRVFQGFDGAW